MREFILPFKPEELLAQPADDRLWASNLPDVENWDSDQINRKLDKLISKVLATHGHDLAQESSFSLLFALLQAWPRLDDGIRLRVADLLIDAARRLVSRSAQVQKAAKKDGKQNEAVVSAKTIAKVAIFFMRWAAERLLRKNPALDFNRKGRGKGAKKVGNSEQEAEELKEAQKVLDRQRSSMLAAISELMTHESMPWLWLTDTAAWQQVAERVSDAGFLALESPDALKHRETRQAALNCIASPLLQEGHQHSNLLVASVSKLTHALRGGEHAAPFVADVLVIAHSTSLPRLLIVELTQHCTGSELTSQGGFQRAMGQFLVAVSERLPHVVLANISVLLPLLDVDCYPLRSAIVEGMGQLLAAEGRKIVRGKSLAPSSQGEGGVEQAGADGEPNASEAASAEQKEDLTSASASAGRHEVFTLAEATKKDLLDTLMARTLDKTVWVRVRSLQTLTNLASNKRGSVLPADLWPHALEIGIKRMQDTATSARKAAMQLVRALIATHPYGPALVGGGSERTKIEALLREVVERVKRLDREEAAEEAAKGGADFEDAEGEEASAAPKRRRIGKKSVAHESIAAEVDRCLASEVVEDDEATEERQKQRIALKKMMDCYTQRLKFVELIDSAEARLRILLSSRVPTDVTESINVVVELRLRELPVAAKAFNQVLGLVWSRHGPIKEAAVEAFRRMHLDGRDAAQAVRALLEMYREGVGNAWTYTHLASVQELIQQAAEQQFVEPEKAVPHLVAAMATPACHDALRALAAFGVAAPDTTLKALPDLHKVLEGAPDTAMQLERTSLLCHMLHRLHACIRGLLSSSNATQFLALSEKSMHVVLQSFCADRISPQWFAAAQGSMDVAFDLATTATSDSTGIQCCPDKLWEMILERMLGKVLSQPNGASGAEVVNPLMDGDVNMSQANDSVAAEADESMDGLAGSQQFQVVEAEDSSSRTSSRQLSCVIFVAGHLALKMLVYLEYMQAALKKKRMTEEDARMAEKREANKSKKPKKSKGAAEPEPEENEATSMGGVGQDEREADAFHDLAEHTLLYGQGSILSKVKPLILAGLLDATNRKDPVLRRAAAISLCKFMTVSKRFCQENLQLLFSILFPKGSQATSLLSQEDVGEDGETIACEPAMSVDLPAGHKSLLEDLTLRQSLLVAVGDLLFRHPNVVEPWTGRLYAALGGDDASAGDGAAELRLTALLVLTHLVLNDMMKPRAVLLVRALWLTACSHERTARVARLLFQELSKKTTNVIYNLAPEIIARMPEHRASAGSVEGTAEARVQWIMQFIDKEKHVEGLTEKISVRLSQAADKSGKAGSSSKGASGAEDGMVSCLAHALSAMNFSERCLMRLHDIVVVRKALNVPLSYHAVVRDCMLAIVEKVRRAKTPKAAGGDAAPPAAAAPASEEAAGAAGEGSKGGLSAAAAAAADAIEQLVTALQQGQAEAAEDGAATAATQDAGAEEDSKGATVKTAATPARLRASEKEQTGARGAKRGGGGKPKAAAAAAEPEAAEADMEPGFEDGEEPEAKPKARNKGKGGGRGRGQAQRNK